MCRPWSARSDGSSETLLPGVDGETAASYEVELAQICNDFTRKFTLAVIGRSQSDGYTFPASPTVASDHSE